MGLLEKIFKKKTPVRNKEDGSSLERYKKSFILFRNKNKTLQPPILLKKPLDK